MTLLVTPNERFQSISAGFLALILAVSILVMFLGSWINPSLFQAGLFLLGVTWMVALAVRPFQLRFSVVLIPLAATFTWGLFQLVAGITTDRWDTWMTVLVWWGNWWACFLAMQVCGSARIRSRFLDTLLYFALVLSVVSVAQYFSSHGKIYWIFPSYEPALLGPFLNRDQYAAFVEMVLPLCMMRTLSGGPRSLRFAVISVALYASAIAGESRAGALLTTAEIVVVPAVVWMKDHSRRRQLRSATLKVWLLTVLVAVVGWSPLWSRFEEPEPLKERVEMLTGTFSMIRAEPYHGFGLGSFSTAYPAYASVDLGRVVNHAHNDWAEWAADGGIPFVLLLIWIAVWSFPRALKSVWGLGLIAVFVHSLVDFPLQIPALEFWLFTLLGVLAAETETRR